MLTKAELIADGCVKNPHIYIADGWMYCPTCQVWQFHEALSHLGLGDCYECCQTCGHYHGQHALKGRVA